MPEPADSPLITPRELSNALAAADPPVVLDLRSDYAEGHIPTAVAVNLRAQLSGPGGPHDGRTPLPAPDALQEAMRDWGVCTGRLVVAYDDASGLSAGRAWWVLRWAGHAPVRVLDGGLSAWLAAGGELTTEVVVPDRGDITVRPGSVRVSAADDVAALPATGALVDAREPDRYRGESDPLDPVAGHIPGAISLPTSANLGPDGRFLPAEQLRERFAAAGLVGREPIVVYCGSGVSAAHELIALQTAGLDAVLYPPSWSGWTSDPNRPVATGQE